MNEDSYFYRVSSDALRDLLSLIRVWCYEFQLADKQDEFKTFVEIYGALTELNERRLGELQVRPNDPYKPVMSKN